MINGYKKFKFQKIKYLNNIKLILLLKLRKLAKNKKITFSNYIITLTTRAPKYSVGASKIF